MDATIPIPFDEEGAQALVAPKASASLELNSPVEDSPGSDEGTATKTIAPSTDLRRLDRKIWVVTTAALPWRTGTSVNPLARALYLTRGRPKDAVTLMIPWVADLKEQAKIFGDTFFANPSEQEAWIRNYCIDRVHCEEEAQNLRIRFYKATYNKGFGSIFATEDICALIPDEEADVCILEEPEHMNWFRVVNFPEDEGDSDEDEELTEDEDSGDDNSSSGDAQNNPSDDKNAGTNCKSGEEQAKGQSGEDSDEGSDAKSSASSRRRREILELGWQVKFNHVVGIVHTNYDHYVRKYGMGAAFLAASALHALSSMVTRAYCHRVIRLSDTLPTLDAPKEITSNVHGVRSEFLELTSQQRLPSGQNAPTELKEEKKEEDELAAIYFIGKLIWAKGFDKMLRVQDYYKKQTGSYFEIDIYGSGPDEKAIKRGFFGRKGLLEEPPDPNTAQSQELTPDRKAAGMFEKFGSLRDQIGSALSNAAAKLEPSHSIATGPTNNTSTNSSKQVQEQIEVVWDEAVAPSGITSPGSSVASLSIAQERDLPNPFVILSDISGEVAEASVSATKAGAKVGQGLVDLGIHAAFSMDETADDNSEAANSESQPQQKRGGGLRFDPPMSRYELRRHPVPARFLGMKDHAVIRDMARHKIFFNPSTSEVLCTTSAEALAMGKFVILPKHPSNTFFLQFSNCLAYSNKDECVESIQYALANEPKPLSKKEIFVLTWEGANERLYDASAMTEDEVKAWKDSGRAKGDQDTARLHLETIKRGRGVHKLWKG